MGQNNRAEDGDYPGTGEARLVDWLTQLGTREPRVESEDSGFVYWGSLRSAIRGPAPTHRRAGG